MLGFKAEKFSLHLRIFTGENHRQTKLQRLEKVRIWALRIWTNMVLKFFEKSFSFLEKKSFRFLENLF